MVQFKKAAADSGICFFNQMSLFPTFLTNNSHSNLTQKYLAKV